MVSMDQASPQVQGSAGLCQDTGKMFVTITTEMFLNQPVDIDVVGLPDLDALLQGVCQV